MITSDSDEEHLSRRLKRGDDAAWTTFFDRYGPRVWSYVAKLTGADRHTVADLVQDVFTAAAQGLRNFDPARGTLVSWLLGIAHRHAALFWRRQSTAPPDSGLNLDLFEGPTDPDHLLVAETSVAVRRMLATLPEDMATILIARYLDDRSMADLAVEFGCTVDAVRSRLLRARDRFRELFETVRT
ncbi:MAG: RNA polymerase sigma factor [Planctomycetaceae bacterium]|nr:RNA polymerase sigma factor [Planctomycetaceae bacterium]